MLTLNSNRYAKSNARETANEAAYQARHAMYLANIIEKLKKDDKNWEKLIREFEITLDTIAVELGFEGEYDKGYSEAQKNIVLAIQNIQEGNENLTTELRQLQSENEELQQKIQQYENTVVNELEKNSIKSLL